MTNRSGPDHDLFISYTYDDASEIVEVLVRELEAMGLDVWYDGTEIGLGDSIRKSIDSGLKASDFGVVVLSESYFEGTSEFELNAIVGIHTSEENFILPLWYELDHEDVMERSPTLADLRAETLSEGNLPEVAGTIYQEIKSKRGAPEEDLSEEPGSLFTDVGIRFQGNYTPEVGDKLTLKVWRNHNAPSFERLEAVEIESADGVEYNSGSGGTVMTISTVEKPIEGVVSGVQQVRTGKVEFTIRVKQSRLDELPDEKEFYRNLI